MQNLLILLPTASLLLLGLIVFSIQKEGWRSAILAASVIWGVWLVGITEFLSIFQLINFSNLLAFWTLTTFILGAICWQKREKIVKISSRKAIELKLDPYLIGVGFIVFGIAIIAAIAPPNNYDSMTYHMSRVVHWIQNQSIAHYPTNILRQLYLNPGAEYGIMHLQILTDSDRFANFVQWYSMVGSIIGVSLIAKQLGSDRKGQIFASVFCATIPMGILQGSSTQNDYVGAFWLVCFVWSILRIITRQNACNYLDLLIVGASLGLGILSKGTVYIYAFPFCILIGLEVLKKFRWNFYRPIGIIGFTCLAINLGYYIRNFSLFGSPVGLSGGQNGLTNEVLNISTFYSNIIRNIAIHAASPIAPLNQVLEKIVNFSHNIFNLDINDPSRTWPGTQFAIGWGNLTLLRHEDFSANFIHLLLILFGLFLWLARKELRENKYLTSHIISVILGFLMFCLLFKWQPWHSRLHLPIFVLFAPAIGHILSKIIDRKISHSIVTAILVLSIPWLFYNHTRPLLGANNIFSSPRIEQYFNSREGLQEPYIKAANLLKSKECFELGLSVGEDSWEYPLWVLLDNRQQKPKIRHINVTNISSTTATTNKDSKDNYCAIFFPQPVKTEQITSENNLYIKKLSIEKIPIHDSVSVFIESDLVSLSTISDLTIDRDNYKYNLGEDILFSRLGDTSPAVEYQKSDWSQAEEWGTWTDGKEASLPLKIDSIPSKNIELIADVNPFVNDKHPQQKIDILVNGTGVGSWTFNYKEEAKPQKVLIPRELISEDKIVEITFHLNDAKSPAELKINTDRRLLGIGVKKIRAIDSQN